MFQSIQQQFHRIHEVCVVIYVFHFVLEYAHKANVI